MKQSPLWERMTKVEICSECQRLILVDQPVFMHEGKPVCLECHLVIAEEGPMD